MINYFNFARFHNDYLLTNDFGSYSFVTKTELYNLLKGQVDMVSPKYNEWIQKGFILSDNKELALQQGAEYYRSAKSYLFSATSLHIFVVTNYCNAKCIYCQAQDRSNIAYGFMSIEIAERAVDIALSSPEQYLSFEFQGGEPLSNFSVIQHIVHYADEHKRDHNIEYSIVTNLTLLTQEMIEFFIQHKISISTSLDGYQELHDMNRPYKSGDGTFQAAISSIAALRDHGVSVGAIQTTTKNSLSHSQGIVDAYIELGFKDIFLRPLTPLGFAKTGWLDIGYTANEFVTFYETALSYIIERNIEGYPLREGHASIFMRKIMEGLATNYMELRSPCGATIGQLAYYYNGDVFTCDEGRMLYEMGSDAFRLGNVFSSTYEQIVDSGICKATCSSSILEALPSCSNCVYQPYCGTCPVLNYDCGKNIISSQKCGYRCKIYKGILDCLFEILYRNHAEEIDVLKGWY